MPKITAVLTGDKDLDKKLRRLKSAQAKTVFRKAARKTIKPFNADVKAEMPQKTGTLKKSTKVRAIKRSRKWIGIRVTVGQKYAAQVDLGTKHIEPKNRIKRLANQKRKTIQRQFGQNLATEIKALAKK